MIENIVFPGFIFQRETSSIGSTVSGSGGVRLVHEHRQRHGQKGVVASHRRAGTTARRSSPGMVEDDEEDEEKPFRPSLEHMQWR
jgi:hypothetical protein